MRAEANRDVDVVRGLLLQLPLPLLWLSSPLLLLTALGAGSTVTRRIRMLR